MLMVIVPLGQCPEVLSSISLYWSCSALHRSILSQPAGCGAPSPQVQQLHPTKWYVMTPINGWRINTAMRFREEPHSWERKGSESMVNLDLCLHLCWEGIKTNILAWWQRGWNETIYEIVLSPDWTIISSRRPELMLCFWSEGKDSFLS